MASAATSAALRCCRADNWRLLLLPAPDAGRLPEAEEDEDEDTDGSEPLPTWAESGCTNGGTGLPPGSSGAAAADGGRDDERLGLAELMRGRAASALPVLPVEADDDEEEEALLLPSWGREDDDADDVAASAAAADAADAAAAVASEAVDEEAASAALEEEDEDEDEDAGAREKTPGNLPSAVLGCAGPRATGDASGDTAAATAA